MAGNDQHPNTGDSERKAAQRELADAWNQVGRFFEDTAAVGQRISSRNLDLWRSVSRKLDGDDYGATEMATDATRAALVAMRNMGDLWSSVTKPQERENVAPLVPTIFLFFDRTDGNMGALLPDTVIRVNVTEGQELPERAYVVLDGTDAAGVDALKKTLDVRRAPGEKGAYLLQTIGGTALNAGTYGGYIFITDPTTLIATLTVRVELPPDQTRQNPAQQDEPSTS